MNLPCYNPIEQCAMEAMVQMVTRPHIKMQFTLPTLTTEPSTSQNCDNSLFRLISVLVVYYMRPLPPFSLDVAALAVLPTHGPH